MTDEDPDRPDPRLASLARELPPPPGLDDRVVAALRADGLLSPPARRGFAAFGLAAAAALALFVGGGLLGRWSARPAPRPEPAERRPTFALFLYEDAAFQVASAEELPARVQEYVAWGRDLGPRGRTVGGSKLGDDGGGVVLDGTAPGTPAARAVPDPALGTMDGFFLIQADSLDAAVELARTCPHVRYGGRILVRETDPGR